MIDETEYFEQFRGDDPAIQAVFSIWTFTRPDRRNPTYAPVSSDGTVYFKGQPLGSIVNVKFEGLDRYLPDSYEKAESHVPIGSISIAGGAA